MESDGGTGLGRVTLCVSGADGGSSEGGGADGRPRRHTKLRRGAEPLSTAEENSSQTQRRRNSHPLCQYLPAGLKSNTLILKVVTLSEAGKRRGELERGGAAPQSFHNV